MESVNALEPRNASKMQNTGQIPLRFLHTLSANFTLPIHKKPLSTTLLPFSLKKISEHGVKHGSNRTPVR
jgi:hypothetical protein